MGATQPAPISRERWFLRFIAEREFDLPKSN
jgi:hypothetical protein